MAAFAPLSALPVVASGAAIAPVNAIPVYVINDNSVPVAPVNAHPVVDVTGNPAYKVAPVQPIPVKYGTPAPTAPLAVLPIVVVGTVP